MSNPQKTPDDYIKEALARFAQHHAQREYGEGLVWLGTAAILDSDKDRADPCSPVNTALFQVAYDAACDSEKRVLKCGNVTTISGEFLSHGRDAADILVTRLDEKAPEAARSLAIVLKTHFDAMFRRFWRHYDASLAMQYVTTTGEDAQFCLDSCKAIRQLVTSFEGLELSVAVNEVERQQLLHICVTSPRYEVPARYLTFLNLWDKALFYVGAAQYLLDELKTSPSMQSESKAQAVLDLADALKSARAVTESKDAKKAKAAYRLMAEKCQALIGDQRHVSLDF